MKLLASVVEAPRAPKAQLAPMQVAARLRKGRKVLALDFS